MIELRTPAEIERLRIAGEFVGSVLTATAAASAVGVNLLELDALAHDMIRARGAESCYIDYHPSFGGSPSVAWGSSTLATASTKCSNSPTR